MLNINKYYIILRDKTFSNEVSRYDVKLGQIIRQWLPQDFPMGFNNLICGE